MLHLLFVLSHWHGLAKLRLYTDETLRILEMVTKEIGDCIRSFVSNTCPSFETRELPREAEARRRRRAQQGTKGKSVHSQVASHPQTRQSKVLNLQTYKLHALADYPAQIRMHGTTDSYSTQAVSSLFLMR